MTILMREQEIARDNFEKGKLEGIAEGVVKGREEGREEGMAEGVIKGREEGIKNLIETCIEFGISRENIIQKLTEKYNLAREESEKYLN